MTALATKLAAARSTKSWHLALDKFPFRLDDQGQPSLSTAPDHRGHTKSIKTDILTQVRDAYTRSKPELETALRSRRSLLDALARQHGDRFRRVTLVNSSRLLLHLGRASVLENVGLYADRTTGLPLIPGSAVKGIVSTWACWEANHTALFTPDAQGNIHLQESRHQFGAPLARQVLGDNRSTGSDHAGDVIFLGAWPLKVPLLGLDIVTPHTNAAGRDQPPVPNPFLAIESGTRWEFILIAHTSLEAKQAKDLLDTAARWLAESLGQTGLGAKTAAGYGRFISEKDWMVATLSAEERDRAETAARREADRLATLARMNAAVIGDYDNDLIFANRVLKRLNPGQLNQLESEFALLAKSENTPWRLKLIEALRGKEMKDLRKRLKDKPWFNQDWLPR